MLYKLEIEQEDFSSSNEEDELSLSIVEEGVSHGSSAQSSSLSPSRQRERKALLAPTTAAFSNTSSIVNGGSIRPRNNCCCCTCDWLWNGGQSSSSSRWIRRFALLGLSLYLLVYHVIPMDWNHPVKKSSDISESSITTTKKNVVAQPKAQPPIITPVTPPSSPGLSDSHQLAPNTNDNDEVINPTTRSDDGDDNVVKYSCPITVTLPENLLPDNNIDSNHIISTPHAKLLRNTTAYLSVYHNVEYDDAMGGYYSYNNIKQSMFHWKSTKFGNALQNIDNATIYESGCGIGLNLVMTLEILYESRGISNLQVYGNDYSANSIQIAHNLIKGEGRDNGILSPMNGQLGMLCRADSAKLHEFVPQNSFDLVFTGYIPPLQDALHLNMSTLDDLDREYRIICQQQHDEQQQQQTRTAPLRTAADIIQRRQEDWFGIWVNEMIHIAKPGAPIIIEHVSLPYCQVFSLDGGGVTQDFWKIAVQRYQWNVNVDSIEFDNDSIIKTRYHVFMRKNINTNQ